MRLGTRPGAYLGVDIGSACIKAVELVRTNGSLAVRAAAAAPTPPGAVEEGRIGDAAAVGRALRDLLAGAGIRARQVVASVNGQVALVRELRMPALPAAEIRQAARFEVERYLPYPITEVTYDTSVVGETQDAGSSRMDVLVVAARTDVLRQHAATMRAAGLDPVAIDVESFAVARALSRPDAPSAPVCVYVHLGAVVTGILIAEGEIPRVIRTVTFGSAALGRGQDAPAEALGTLTTEIRRSLEYYGGRYRGTAPDRVVVTGGGARPGGLTEHLAAALDLPVEIGDPFAQLGGPPEGGAPDDGALYAVAAGLARRGAEES